MDVKEISVMLGQRVDALVPAILPAAVREGPEWRVGSVHGERGRSMAIHRSGSRQGVWKDFSDSGMSGDALDLVCQVACNGDMKAAVAWAKAWLGLDRADPKQFEQRRKQAAKAAADKERDHAVEVMRRKQAAKALWLKGSPAVIGSPVDLYLLGRAIGLGDMDKVPGSLRYLSGGYCIENGQKFYFDAMVAAVVNGQGEHIATHRTFLKRHDQAPDVWVKASPPLADAKKVLGPYRGGFIPLSRGASGKGLKDAPDGDVMILCEGIEDGLSLSLALPECRVGAAVSVGNFRNIDLPPAVASIYIAADNDAPGSPAARAVDAAVQRFLREGRSVFVMRASSGKDFNDVLRGDADMVVEQARA